MTIAFHAGVGGPSVSEVNGEALRDGSEVRIGLLPESYAIAQFAANPAEIGKVWQSLGAGVSRALFGQPGRFAASADSADRTLTGRRLYVWILRSTDGQPIRPDYGNVSAHALLTSARANWTLPSLDALPPDNTRLLALGETDQVFAGVKTSTRVTLANASSVNAGLTYNDWALVTIGNGDRSPSTDIDSDGLVNLLEFLVGGDPLRIDKFDPVLTTKKEGGKTYLEMSFELPRNRLGVRWVVEASSDLVHWSAVSNITITDQGDETQLVIARDSVAAEDEGGKRFMRINVSQ